MKNSVWWLRKLDWSWENNLCTSFYVIFRRYILEKLLQTFCFWIWEDLQSAFCKLENQGSWWYNLVWDWRSENQEADGVIHDVNLKASEPGDRCRRAGEDLSPGSSKESKFALPLSFCPIQVLSGLSDAHLCWGGPSFSLSRQISNANHFWKHPHRHLEITFYQHLGIC